MKCLKKLSYLFFPLFCTFLLTMMLNVSITPLQPVVYAADTASTLSSMLNGSWQGQGTYYNGGGRFNMLLTVTSARGSTFSGTLAEDTYNSVVAITGNITRSTRTGTSITFTDPSTISGGRIALHTTYTADISNGQMNGFWYFFGHSSPDGTIFLSSTSSSTGDVRLQWATDWAKKQVGSMEWIENGETYCERFVENAYGVTHKAANPLDLFKRYGGVYASPALAGEILIFKAMPENGNNGHAAIYMGGDSMISVQNNGVRWNTISSWNRHAKYVGFVYPPRDWPGAYGKGAVGVGSGGYCAKR